jgi:hypothetical protein
MNTNSVIKFQKASSLYILLQSGSGWNLTAWGGSFPGENLIDYKDAICSKEFNKYIIGINSSGKLVPVWDPDRAFSSTILNNTEVVANDCKNYSSDAINSIKSNPTYKACILKKVNADAAEKNYYGSNGSPVSQQDCLKNQIGTLASQKRITKTNTVYTYCKQYEIKNLPPRIQYTPLGNYLKSAPNALKIVGKDPLTYALLENGKIFQIFYYKSYTYENPFETFNPSSITTNPVGVNLSLTDIRRLPLDTTGVIDYQFGAYHSIALLNNGYLTGWGYGKYKYGDYRVRSVDYGNSLEETRNQGQLLIPPSIQGNVASIAVGGYHTVALLNNGHVTGWGYESRLTRQGNEYSWSNSIDIVDSPATWFPSSIQGKVKKIKAENYATKILLNDGTVTGFGAGYGTTYAQGNLNQNSNYYINGLIEVNKKFSGYIDDFLLDHTYVIKSGSIIFLTGIAYSPNEPFPQRSPLLKTPQNSYVKQYGLDNQFSLNIESDTPELGPIKYNVANTSIASCNQNGLVTINNSGTTYIEVSQDGNKFFNNQYYQKGAYPILTIPLVVNPKIQQYITFPSLSVKTLVNDNNFRLGISSNSPLPITLGGYDTSMIEITNNDYVNIKNTGITTITASQAGNSAYHAASNVSRNLIIIYDKSTQNLNVDSVLEKQYNDLFYLPSQTNNNFSGNVTYTTPSDGLVEIVDYSGIKINFFNPSQVENQEVIVTATQSGDEYNYPFQKDISIIVNKIEQTITFPSIPSQKFRKSIFYITGNSDSNLKLDYLISNSSIARIVNGNGIKMLKTGTFQISGTQIGNDYYEPATPVVRNFTILKGNQTIKL